MRDFYEPWTPKRGQRVEIRPSPECQLQAVADSPAARAGFPPGHRPWETGLRGTVRRQSTSPLMRKQGHRFQVEFDEPVKVGEEWCTLASYAAVELRPIDPEPRPLAAGARP